MVIEISTVILTIITAIYAFLTPRMAKLSKASVDEMKKQSEMMMRPYITVTSFLRPHTTFLYLRIKNTGKTAAENIKLIIDKDFFSIW